MTAAQTKAARRRAKGRKKARPQLPLKDAIAAAKSGTKGGKRK